MQLQIISQSFKHQIKAMEYFKDKQIKARERLIITVSIINMILTVINIIVILGWFKK